MFVGIDPGATGGIALLSADHKLMAWAMPETERDISDVFEAVRTEVLFAMIEIVHSMPEQGVSSSFSFGQNYGFLRGMLIAHKIPFGDVTPQKWQRALNIPSGKGKTKTQHKNDTKARAQEIFPERKMTHAIADASLIAEYVWRSRVLGNVGEPAIYAAN